MWEAVEGEAKRLGIAAVPRVTVEGSTRQEVRRALEEVRRGALVAVRALSLDALRYSSVNKRVHLIRVEPGLEKFIDKSELRLFKARGWGALEVSLREARSRRGLAYLYEACHRAHLLDVNLVISSDAEMPEDLWSPLAAIGLLASMGIPSWRAKSWMTSVPAYVLDRILS
ncbi:MAG: hypothetical protein N3F67_00315 [Acidilobaceae archaeon]|nr:hypothetical protein [Acidilobaceae archaeon]